MYEQFFHLKKRPFSIAPDPGFLYLSDRHRDALAHLKYGLESDGGFVLVTGEVGTGKTTLLRNIIGQVPGDIDVAFILNPRLTVRELLQTICDELGIDYPTEDQHSVKPYIDRLNKHLLQTHQTGRSTVVVIDEAQNLSPAVLEQLRLLTNLETNERKLLRIILVGQPELKAMLGRQELRQLSQRITARYHLEPLKLADTRAYLSHRLSVSGGNPNLFSTGASWNIHRHAHGIPRLINIIADRAMLGAYADGKPRIDFLTSQKAAKETQSDSKNVLGWIAMAGALIMALVGGWWLISSPATTHSQGEPSPTASATSRERDEQWNARFNAPTENAPQEPRADERSITAQPSVPLTEIVVRNPASKPEAGTATAPDNREASELDRESASALIPGETLDSPAAVTQLGQNTEPQLTQAIPAPVLTPPVVTPPSSVQVADSSDAQSSVPQPAANVPSYRSQRLAFATMYGLWGIDYQPDDATVPCDYAPRYQLQCTKRVSTWQAVQRLNVPVVMQLNAANGRVFYATAISARNGRIALDQGGERSVVDLSTLQSVWDGTIIALWPTPENYRGSLKDGSNGQAVRELRSLLGGAINRDLGNSRIFDAELSRALQEFQSANGLTQDGIAGPATWLLLHRAAGYDIPELLG